MTEDDFIMTDSICSSNAYNTFMSVKRQFQQFIQNSSKTRYDNLSNNPYNKINPETNNYFTKFQLDMRRKAEILKYNSNNSNTKTNNFTKAEIYSQAISGKYQQRTYSLSYTNDTLDNKCPNDNSLKTPTSSCDVPGSVIYLYENKNVPLYKFNTNIDSNYGILSSQQIEKMWDYSIIVNKYMTEVSTTKQKNTVDTNNIITSNSIPAVVTSIYIFYQDIQMKSFIISIPILLKFTGTKTANNTSIIKFNINSIITEILYNNKTYKTLNDTQYNKQVIITTTSNDNVTFNGNFYCGLLNISNVLLPIQKGYVFDIRTTIEFYYIYDSNVTLTYLTAISNPEPNLDNTIRNIPTSVDCRIENDTPFPNNPPKLSITSFD
jgi:hypothetical protein